jgi:hypothetical protein
MRDDETRALNTLTALVAAGQLTSLPETALPKCSQPANVDGGLLLTPNSLSPPRDLFLPLISLGTASG